MEPRTHPSPLHWYSAHPVAMTKVETISTHAGDISALWKDALFRYEAKTGVRLDSVAEAGSLEEVISHIQENQARFGKKRHSGSKFDRFRTLVKRSLEPIAPLGKIVGHATKSVRAPHQSCPMRSR